MKSYKHRNGHRVFRSGNGRFRKTTLADMGINDANTDGTIYICNVCEHEFVPILHSGKCCGVDNKRKKIIELTPDKQRIQDKIMAIMGKPFINRQDLEEIKKLEREIKTNLL
jgi:hypothetical protein